MSQRTSHTHCQSPTSQRLNQSFAKECACPTPKEKLKISSPSENKKYPNPQADTKPKNNLTMLRKFNIDNGLQGQRTERQLVTACIVHLADSADFKGSAFNKLSGGLTVLCFESPNDTIHAIRYGNWKHFFGQGRLTTITNDETPATPPVTAHQHVPQYIFIIATDKPCQKIFSHCLPVPPHCH